MKKSEAGEFRELITALAAAFGRERDEALLSAYWMALQDLELGQIATAVAGALRECKYFPLPVELRRMCGEVPASEQAVIAWGVVTKTLREKGIYQSVDFDDPVVNATIRNMGGWQALGMKEGDDYHVWARKEFERIYAALSGRDLGEEQAAPLIGIHDQENASRGYLKHVKDPLRIETGIKKLAGAKLKLLKKKAGGDD